MHDRFDSIEFDSIEYLATSGGLGAPDSDARAGYYGNLGFPHVVFNGTRILVGAGTDVIDGHVYDPIVRELLDDPTPLKMTISSFSLVNPGAHVTVDLELVGDLTGVTLPKLRVAVLEDDLVYGSTTYHHVLRDILPIEIPTITVDGQTEQFTINFTANAGWDVANTRLLAFVQDDANKEIVQSCNSLPTPDYSLRYYQVGDKSQIASGQVDYQEFAVFNTGTLADVYDISLDTSELPAGWSGSFSYGGTDYTNLSLNLDPGNKASLYLTVNTAGAGGGDVVLTLHSQSGLVADKRIVFTVITPDVQVLIVDDDGGEDYENLYFEPAVITTGKSHATWNLSATALTSTILANFEMVVWQCGWSFPTVDAGDRTAISQYLDGGGNLFITGQDIGWELNEAGGSALAWYNNYLHADYVADDTNMLSLTGVAGDPITDGLSLSISGGDGASNQQYPSDIDPMGAEASVILTYDALRNGGIKVDTGTYKVVYLSFGYEAINNATDRAALMQGIVDWMIDDTSGDGGKLPGAFALHGNVPNPFNPKTEIQFSIGTESRVRLDVYDVKGRLVRALENGVRSAGQYSVAWDGTDNDGRALPSGTYFCRVDSEGLSESVKMMLVR